MGILLGILVTISALNALFCVYSITQSNKALIEVEAFKKSTHTVQYIDPSASTISEEVQAQAKDFENAMDMSYSEFNDIYGKKLSEDFAGIVDPVDFEFEKGKRRSY